MAGTAVERDTLFESYFTRADYPSATESVDLDGRLVMAVADGTLAVSGGVCAWAAQDSAAEGDQIATMVLSDGATSVSRADEPTMVVDASLTTAGTFGIGFFAGESPDTTELAEGLYNAGGGYYCAEHAEALTLLGAEQDPGTVYAVQLDATRGAYYFSGSRLTPFGVYLLAVTFANDDAALYPGLANLESDGHAHYLAIYPEKLFYPLQTLDVAEPAHASVHDIGVTDFVLDFGATFASLTAGQYAECLFRYLDDDNHYRIRATVNEGETAVDLTAFEVSGGVETETDISVSGSILTGTGSVFVQVRLLEFLGYANVGTRPGENAAFDMAASITKEGAYAHDVATSIKLNKSGAGVTLGRVRAWSCGPYTSDVLG